jgi:hypothetical protein
MVDKIASGGIQTKRTLNNANFLLTPNGREYRSLFEQLGKAKPGGKQAEVMGQLEALTAKMTPSDWKSVRYAAAADMRDAASKRITSSNKGERETAMNMLSQLRDGVMPGIMGGPAISIETGEAVASKQTAPAAAASQGWAP